MNSEKDDKFAYSHMIYLELQHITQQLKELEERLDQNGIEYTPKGCPAGVPGAPGGAIDDLMTTNEKYR